MVMTSDFYAMGIWRFRVRVPAGVLGNLFFLAGLDNKKPTITIPVLYGEAQTAAQLVQIWWFSAMARPPMETAHPTKDKPTIPQLREERLRVRKHPQVKSSPGQTSHQCDACWNADRRWRWWKQGLDSHLPVVR
jgi:hypothetical protein